MIRTIKIWILLRELQTSLFKSEASQNDHARETGHGYSAYCPEIDFLEEVAKDDPKKKALFKQYLSIADKNMQFLKVSEEPMPCPDCGCQICVIAHWCQI